jgi:general stress protein 26
MNLDGRYIAVLATENEDGSAYLSAVWFLHEEGVVYVATGGNTRKARNASERPRGSLLVDSRGPGALRGAAARGRLTVLRGEEARAVNERVWAKYLTAQGLADPRVGGVIRAHDDVTIRLEPERWRTWATDEDFGGALEEPGQTLPLDG